MILPRGRATARPAPPVILVLAAVLAANLIFPIDARGEGFIYASFGPRVYRYLPDGERITLIPTGLRDGFPNPRGIAFDAAGNLYTATQTDGNIVKVTPGNHATVFSTGAPGVQGLVIDRDGNFFVANGATNTIEKVTPSGERSLFASDLLNNPRDLAIDAAGNVFAANFGGGTILKFTPEGVGSVFASLDEPFGLDFDSMGRLYATSRMTHAITRFTPDGTASIFASTGRSLFGLTLDDQDNVYVSPGFNNSIDKYTPAGERSSFGQGIGGTITFLAFQVPEPSGGLLIGCAWVLLMKRRRRPRPTA